MNLYMDRILFNLSDDYFYYKKNWKEVEELEKNENYLVYNLTTPSNYFHALRAQVKNPFRKPLLIYQNETTIKKSGSLHELFLPGSSFQKVIDEKHIKDKKNVKKIIFCSGKFYFDIRNIRHKYERDDVALIRLE